MNLPIPTSSIGGLLIAAVFGLFFGVLLQKGRVANYDVIVNFFRLQDMTVLKIMLTAIVVGGIGVSLLMATGLGHGLHIKATQLLGLVIGSALFGVGMVLYGYCPGTGVGAIATGSLHALVGFAGMLVGGIAYGITYPWVKASILTVGDFGKIRITDATGLPDGVWYPLIAIVSIATFMLIQRKTHTA